MAQAATSALPGLDWSSPGQSRSTARAHSLRSTALRHPPRSRSMSLPTLPGAVILRNLSINGYRGFGDAGTFGIRVVRMPAQLHLENVKVFGFNLAGIVIGSSTPVGRSSSVHISNSEITNNVIGIELGGISNECTACTLSAVLDGVSVIGNDGVGVRVAGGTNEGALNLPVSVTITDSVISNNNTVGVLGSGDRSTFYLEETTVTNNARGLLAQRGAKIISFGNNSVGGNTIDGAPTSTDSAEMTEGRAAPAKRKRIEGNEGASEEHWVSQLGECPIPIPHPPPVPGLSWTILARAPRMCSTSSQCSPETFPNVAA